MPDDDAAALIPPLPEGPLRPDDPLGGYVSALALRNASPEMQWLFSPRFIVGLWRRLWLALALGERELGLAITEEQIEQLRAAVDPDDADFARARELERELRHDVMAHVHAYGERAPAAAGIIHLGATSQFINCNAETVQQRRALTLLCRKTAGLILAIAEQARRHRDLPCLGRTHLQPAQPTTVGKRMALWGYDLSLCLERLERTRDGLRLRGVKGATGTQASFLALFEGDAEKVEALDRFIAKAMGFDPDKRHLVTGQTQPRVVDAFVLGDLAALAACCGKIATDVRLLAALREMDEPFGDRQIGSSAMPYKRNPMRCERACALARFVVELAGNAYVTAATQWLERTLDDSANRRLSIPEAFLAMDAVLDLLRSVFEGLEVHEAMCRANLERELPFLATEALLMEAAKLGRDRQKTHEALRKAAQEAAARMKRTGGRSDLLERLRALPELAGVDFRKALDPARFVGLAPQQVDRFLEKVAQPLQTRYSDALGRSPDIRV